MSNYHNPYLIIFLTLSLITVASGQYATQSYPNDIKTAKFDCTALPQNTMSAYTITYPGASFATMPKVAVSIAGMSIIPGTSIKFKYATGVITQSNFDIQIILSAMTSTITIINLYYFAVRPPSYTFSAS